MSNLQPNCCLKINFPRLVLGNIIGNMLQGFFIEILAVKRFACIGRVSLGELRKWIRYIHSKISIKQIRNYIGQGSYLCDKVMLYCFAGITIWWSQISCNIWHKSTSSGSFSARQWKCVMRWLYMCTSPVSCLGNYYILTYHDIYHDISRHISRHITTYHDIYQSRVITNDRSDVDAKGQGHRGQHPT